VSTSGAEAEAARELLRNSLRRSLQHAVQASGGVGAAAADGLALWTTARELGIAALGADPGLGGVQELCAAMEESGYAAAPIPLLPTMLVNRLLAPLPAAAPWIKGLQDGRHLVCLCFGPLDPDQPAAGLRHSGGRISGDVHLIEFAAEATHLAVVEATRLCLVPLAAPGVAIAPQPGLARPALCDIRLEEAACEAFDLDADALTAAFDIARLALVARALGATTRAFELAVDHARLRRQFGQPIGRFQAIQHKLADGLTQIDGVRLALQDAAARCDAQGADWPFLAAAAAAAASPALRQTMLEIQHVFGAIGYSEEHESPHHFRRVHADLMLLGGVRRAREALACQLLDGDTHEMPAQDLGADAERLRGELRAWLRVHWDAAAQRASRALRGGDHGWNPAFSAALGRRGWIGLSWPERCGGGGRSLLEQFALIQEMERAGAPASFHAAAEMLIGPAIMAFGSAEQQQRFLPAILRGELSICLGYSEPEAGSDLAALRTRAVRDGDDWIISGQKLWTTGLEHAQYIWLAARTHAEALSPQAGISIFLVALDTPGISRRPRMAFYGQPFTATFWDGVRVPGDALIGAVDGGWKVITHALAAERLLMGGHATRLEALFAKLCRQIAQDAGLRRQAELRARIGELAAEIGIARQLVLRSARLTAQGKLALHEAAMCKAYTGELMERVAEAALDLLGPRALLGAAADDAPCEGQIEQMLRTSIMMVIGGGTNEIQRNLIAQRGLGLPR